MEGNTMKAEDKRDPQTYAIIGASSLEYKRLVFTHQQ